MNSLVSLVSDTISIVNHPQLIHSLKGVTEHIHHSCHLFINIMLFTRTSLITIQETNAEVYFHDSFMTLSF